MSKGKEKVQVQPSRFFSNLRRKPGPTSQVPAFLKTFQGQLNGFNLSEAASKMGFDVSTLHNYFKRNPDALKKSGIKIGGRSKPTRRAEVRSVGEKMKDVARKSSIARAQGKLILEVPSNLQNRFEVRFNKSLLVVVEVTRKVAGGVIGLDVFRSELREAILTLLMKRAEAQEAVRAPIRLETEQRRVLDAFERQLFASASVELHRPLTVVLDSKNPIAEYLLEIDIVRSLLERRMPIRIKISDTDGNFKRRAESRVTRQLTAEEKNRLLGILKITPEAFRIQASSYGKKGAGVLVQSHEGLADLDRSIAATVANLEGAERRGAAQLIPAILVFAAWLGIFFGGNKDFSDADIAKLKDKLGDLGRSIRVDNGRVIGEVLVQVLRQWFAEERARAELRQAA